MTSKVQKTKLLEAQIKQGKTELLEKARTARLRIQKRIDDAIERKDFILAANVRNTLYKQVAAEYVRLNRGVDDWVDERAMTVSKAWHGLAIKDIPESTGATFGQFSKKYFDDIVGKINPATIDKRVGVNVQIGGMLNEDIRAIRTAVSETIRKGALTGMNNIELTAEMKRAAEAITAGAKFVDKAGKTWNSDSYFGMLNRTLHTNVARETYASTATDAGFDLFVIDGGPSSSDDPDDSCNRWFGKVISMTGATKGYPTYQDAIDDNVFHPNCSHSLGVYIEGLEAAMVNRFDDDGNYIGDK